MKLLELSKKLSASDLVGALTSLTIDDGWGGFNDMSLPWVNNNNPAAIDKMIKVSDFKIFSQIWLFCEQRNVPFNKPLGTVQDFKKFQMSEIKLWRGGPGIYDHSKETKAWSSFTSSRNRVETFSTYNGTRGGRFLDRHMNGWVVELSIPIKNILLYLHSGGDHEVIVSTHDAKAAKVIVQT